MNSRFVSTFSLAALTLAFNVFCPDASYAWTCDAISDGPPGTCLDCIFICGRLLDANTLELAIYVDKEESGVLCSADVYVEQDEVLFDDLVVPASPISFSVGWHALDTVETLQTAGSYPISISASGNFAANAGACD